jgi:hypothetical protein
MQRFFNALATTVIFSIASDAIDAATLVDFGAETFDPKTQLIWRDLTGTTGVSVQEMDSLLISDPGFMQYRRATASETYTLFQHAGIVSFGQFTEANVSGAQRLIDLLGRTQLIECGVGGTSCNGSNDFQRYRVSGMGFTADTFGLGLAISTFIVESRFTQPENIDLLGYGLAPAGSGVVDFAFEQIGHFLVRDLPPGPPHLVPAPSTLPLLGLGLFALSLMRRKGF